jgi:hypothetical protein
MVQRLRLERSVGRLRTVLVVSLALVSTLRGRRAQTMHGQPA